MRVLITGAGGILGSAAQRVLPELDFDVVPCTHAQLDITNEVQIKETLARTRPAVVLNCAAYTRVDDAEMYEAEALAVNTTGAAKLARACAQIGARIVYPSTDYVFAGDARQPYRPGDAKRPINAYGRSKLGGEEATQGVTDYLIVRTSWLFGSGGANFVRTMHERLQRRQKTRVVQDQTGRLTYARDAASAIGRLLRAKAPSAAYHVANAGTATWYEVARTLASHLGVPDLIAPCTTRDYPRPAQRPPWSVLDTSETDRLVGPLRSWQDALTAALNAADF